MTGVEIALIAAAAISAVGAIQQGQAASDASDFNMQLAQNNALGSRQAAAESAKREKRLGMKRAGRLRLADVSVNILTDSAIEQEVAIQSVLHAGELEALGFSGAASLARMRGSAAKTESYIAASSSLLSTGAKIA
jgi:hypothetical protein